MKYVNKRKMFGLGLFSIIVLMLVFFTGYISYMIISNSYNKSDVKVNKETVNYISFLFEHSDNHVIDIKNPKVVSDEVGKLLFGEDYFSFDINIDKDQITDKSLEYYVTVEAIGETINEDYIKFYLTDKDEKPINNSKVVPVISDYDEEENISGKIIYTGKFSKDNINQKLNLRVWISDEYDLDDIAGFSYRLNVLVKQ